MRVEDMLERYVREVADRLPVRMRSDVTLELASLLREDLQAKAEAAGRAPDQTLALEVLQAFGHPNEVAARYNPKSAIIDPSDTRRFISTVIIGSAILLATSVPTALLEPERSRGAATVLLWWIGAVVVLFAAMGWARRRWPEKHRWLPGKHDPDQVNRTGMIALIVLIGISVAIFAEPQRMFAWLTGGGRLASSLDYDPGFRSLRLPWLFAVWLGQGTLLAVLAVRGRWSLLLRRVDMVLSAAILVLFAWYRADGPVMAQAAPDETVKAFMAMIALLLLIDIGVKLYRQAGHVSAARLHEALSR